MNNENARDQHHTQIDILDALRLLHTQAADEARPILRAAADEIKTLRARIQELTQDARA